MKTYLLPQKGDFYKANLHSHTTFSDAAKTPQEVKEIYKNMGYSVLAITDHEILFPHDELNDKDFLCLHGFEMDVSQKDNPENLPFRFIKSCHIGFIALEPDNLIQPCYNREKYVYGDALKHRDKIKFDDSLPDYIRDVTPESITDIMTTAREKGFFVTYNHPTWNGQSYDEYMGFHGMHAVEIFNGGCIVGGYGDNDIKAYDDFLRSNRPLYCIGADDNHNIFAPDSRKYDSGIAFTMIKAEKLEYRAITKALEEGNFYASCGPLIEELYFEDGKIHIKCSEADSIICNYGVRRTETAYSEGEPLKEAVFSVETADKFFRITVTDKNGTKACTNGYFTKDLF
ncbi:MAG: hypothetical protein IKT44_01530 [Clostridia bacterium]|nr:hypothetical protein [Clostridia bacterium]